MITLKLLNSDGISVLVCFGSGMGVVETKDGSRIFNTAGDYDNYIDVKESLEDIFHLLGDL